VRFVGNPPRMSPETGSATVSLGGPRPQRPETQPAHDTGTIGPAAPRRDELLPASPETSFPDLLGALGRCAGIDHLPAEARRVLVAVSSVPVTVWRTITQGLSPSCKTCGCPASPTWPVPGLCMGSAGMAGSACHHSIVVPPQRPARATRISQRHERAGGPRRNPHCQLPHSPLLRPHGRGRSQLAPLCRLRERSRG